MEEYTRLRVQFVVIVWLEKGFTMYCIVMGHLILKIPGGVSTLQARSSHPFINIRSTKKAIYHSITYKSHILPHLKTISSSVISRTFHEKQFVSLWIFRTRCTDVRIFWWESHQCVSNVMKIFWDSLKFHVPQTHNHIADVHFCCRKTTSYKRFM